MTADKKKDKPLLLRMHRSETLQYFTSASLIITKHQQQQQQLKKQSHKI
jgi:hypothetical protein